MKKILNVLFAILLTFVFANTVNAVELQKGVKYKVNTVTEGNTGVYCADCYSNNGSNYYDDAHIIQYTLDGKYALYCMDLNKKQGDNVEIYEVVSGSSDAYFKGLTALSNVGYTEGARTSGYGLSGFKFYSATNLAIRIYQMAMGMSRTGIAFVNPINISAAGNYNYAISNTAATWMAENKDTANVALMNYSFSTAPFKKSARDFWNDFGVKGDVSVNKKTAYNKDVVLKDNGSGVLNAAKEMFKVALNAAAGRADATGPIPSTKISDHQTLAAKPINDSENYGEKQYYTIYVNNFTGDDNINDLSVVPTNSSSISSGWSEVKITGYSLDNGKTFVNQAPSNDVLKSLKGTTSIIIEVTSKIKASGYKCDELKYDITYDFYSKSNTSSEDVKVYKLRSKGDIEKYQVFLGLIIESNTGNNVSGGEKRITDNGDFKFDPCGNDKGNCTYRDPNTLTGQELEDMIDKCCVEWEDMCSGDNKYCTYTSNFCGTCNTEITVPEVCAYEADGTAYNVSGAITSAIDDDGNDNAKFCLLIRKKDEAGNSYQAMSNDYCKVYCKEDFEFKLPDAIDNLVSGGYFQLEAKVTGTKTCYTSEIDTELFTGDIQSGRISRNDAINQYNACINMEVDYTCFEPKIKYSYDDAYNNKLTGNQNLFAKIKEEESSKTNTYCNGSVDKAYNCSGSEKGASTVSGVPFFTKYVKSTVTKTADYKTANVFYNDAGTGNVSTNKNELTNPIEVNGLPLSYDANKGKHEYNLEISDIGEFYDQSSPSNCKLGRLIGSEDGVYKKVDLKPNASAQYECYYNVNCPECDFSCDGDLCEFGVECDGPNCVATCVGIGCAYDKAAGLSYTYRTISLNDINPTQRELGYNWNNQKAKATIAEIESNGENVYEDPEYSIVITPAMIRAIKDYNKTALNDGGYSNNTLKCKDYTKNGKTYSNLYCESSFLSDLKEGRIGNANNQITIPNYENKFNSWLDSDYCKRNVCVIENGSGPAHK